MTHRLSLTAVGLLALAACSVYACGTKTQEGSTDGGNGSGSGSGSGSGAGSGASSGSGGDSAAGPGGASVLQHHNSPTRDGLYSDPSMTTTTNDAGTKVLSHPLTLDTAFSPAITGNVYAQPLYVTPGPSGHAEAFIVVTEQNHVLAIDSAGATIWEHPSSAADPVNYGAPVTNVGRALGCGNIDPLGITGTPIIDPTSTPPTIYFDAMTSVGGIPTHQIYAVSLEDGSIKANWPIPVDTAVSGFVSKPQNQRGALALAGGVLYVPYGGHNGDCGAYHGWVLGVDVATRAVTPFSTSMAGGARQGGIWSAGGVAATKDGASLFVSTGNTGGAATWSGGEAVLRLSPGPTFTNQMADEFYPAEWMMDDTRDQDLGGANPVVFDMPSAAGGPQHLIAIPGKDGYLYVLNRDALGGMGGQVSRTAVAPQNTGGMGSLNAAAAVYTTSQGTYVAYHINSGPNGTGCPSGGNGRSVGVAKLVGNPPTPRVVWCTSESGMGSPMVTTSGDGTAIVWDANTRLYGYDGDTGAKVFAGGGAADLMASPLQYFNTPIDAGGRIVVATSGPGHLYVFKP